MRKLLFTIFFFVIILTGYSQSDNSSVTAGAITLESNIPPNPVAGTICWSGTEFLGFNGVQWISLNGIESDASTVPIKIWSYLFQFPKTFTRVPVNDPNSFIGTIEGTGLTLDFEQNFINSLIGTPTREGDISTGFTINGHYIQIIQPSDLNDLTRIIIQTWDDNANSYREFTISINNITRAQQEMLINVFKAVEIVEPSVPIQIGRYLFQFPLGFSLVPGQGTDSYVGNINGAGISLIFDYGPFTRESTNLDPSNYLVIEDEIDGNFRQIVKPVDSQNNFTKLHLYSYSAQLDDPDFHARLTIWVKNINPAEQDMIIDVFNSVEILNGN